MDVIALGIMMLKGIGLIGLLSYLIVNTEVFFEKEGVRFAWYLKKKAHFLSPKITDIHHKEKPELNYFKLPVEALPQTSQTHQTSACDSEVCEDDYTNIGTV